MSSFADKITEQPIRDLYEMWRERCDGPLPPYKRDLTPQSTPFEMWPYLFFYDVTDEGRYFCVHNGTEVVYYFGNETTGHFMEEFISEAFAASVMPLYDGTVEKERAVYYRGDLAIDDERFYEYARLLLPLRNEGGANGHIIGMMNVTGEERSYNRQPDDNRRDIIWDDFT